jgi:uncharacterized protein YrrD
MRLRQFLGRPVMDGHSGEQIGRVDHVLIDARARRITGFRLRRGGLLDRRWRVAALGDVTAMTEAAIVLPDALALREDTGGHEQVFGPRHALPVQDERGVLLGRAIDAQVEPESGRLLSVLVRPAGRSWGSAGSWMRLGRADAAGRRDDTPALIAESTIGSLSDTA